MIKFRQPTFNRILVRKYDPAAVGHLVIPESGPFILAIIEAVGPLAGIRDGTQYHKFLKGDLILVNRATICEGVVAATPFVLMDDDKVLALVSE